MYKLLIIIALSLFAVACAAQDVCYKNIVTQPVFLKKTIEVVTTPAVYETRYEQVTIKSAYTKVGKHNGLDCEIKVPAVTRTVAKQVKVRSEVTEIIEIEVLETNGSVRQVITDCNQTN